MPDLVEWAVEILRRYGRPLIVPWWGWALVALWLVGSFPLGALVGRSISRRR